MQKITQPLAYFATKNTFNNYLTYNTENGTSFPETIVFIGDSGEIYTHGRYFGGGTATVSQETINNITNQVVANLPKATTSQYGVVLLDGDYITTTPDTNPKLTVNIPILKTKIFTPANSSDLGVIKVGYTESGNNYAVKLDNSNKAYVTVPTSTPTAQSLWFTA